MAGRKVGRVAVILQQFVEGFVVVGLDGAHVDVRFGAAVAVPAVVVDDALAQAGDGGFLVALEQRGVDSGPACRSSSGKRSAAIWRAISAT